MTGSAANGAVVDADGHVLEHPTAKFPGVVKELQENTASLPERPAVGSSA